MRKTSTSVLTKFVPRWAQWVAATALGMLASILPLPAAAGPSEVPLLDISGGIGPATADFLHRGLARAADSGAPFVILRIDTPGGLESSMRDINRDILASPIPVVGFVAPSGARAASAGTYILYACHVAAMAPGTNLGAATPVQLGGGPLFPPGGEGGAGGSGGGDMPKDSGRKPDKAERAEKTETMERAGPVNGHPGLGDKVLNDSTAYIRSLAQLRKRNVDWAEKAVREAASLPAEEALRLNVVDLIADDVPGLLRMLDGRRIDMAGGSVTLATPGLTAHQQLPDWRTRFLNVVTDPNVAYILFLVGIYGLLLEFYSPGAVIPGTVGAISLLCALYALQVLPVSYAGAALMLTGIVLMVAEAMTPGVGVFGLGGAIAFVLGSLMLINTDVPGFTVSWLVVGPIAFAATLATLAVVAMAFEARQRPLASGHAQMIGRTGRVIAWQDHAGQVRVAGEIWRARSAAPLAIGEPVVVTQIAGLLLEVTPTAGTSSDQLSDSKER
jgi:membrane-bound serine protease (ClpP class)